MGKFDDLKINKLKLNDELSNQASNFAFACEEAEILHQNMSQLELQLEIKSDRIMDQLRSKYRNVNAKLRPNETALKAIVRSREEIAELRTQLEAVTHAYRISKIRVDALKMKAEMMVSMAHNIRQERKSSSNVKV